MKIKVLATGGYYGSAADGQLPDLKATVREATGVNVRRVSRFVQLALVGAGRCCQGLGLDPDTGVYVSSCRGDAEVTASLLEDMIARREMPGPLTFVNSVSNAACFHVAAVLGLRGRNNFATNRFDPIVAAMELACLDLRWGEVPAALVGSVDVLTLPLDEHRRRTQLSLEATPGEGSHWLLLVPETDPRPAVAAVEAVKSFPRRDALMDWIGQLALPGGCYLAAGQHLTAADAEAVASAAALRHLPYRERLPDYDSQTGAALEYFFGEESAPGLLHLNADGSGRYKAVLLRRSGA